GLVHHITYSSYFFRRLPPPDSYPLSLHDALPIFPFLLEQVVRLRRRVDARLRELLLRRLVGVGGGRQSEREREHVELHAPMVRADRKSTRLNSSHLGISYAVFCLKKKKEHNSHFP